jgi:rubredoxin
MEGMLTEQQLSTAKSTVGVFELPCGYLVEDTNELIREVQLREIKGREEDMLNSSKVPGERKLSALLAGCIERIGSITHKGQIATIVDEMMTGDRVFLLFCLRRVSLGDDLPLREDCPKCGANNFYVIDTSDLEVKKMKDPYRRTFDAELPSGLTARFRVGIGKDEIARAKMKVRNKNEQLSAAILMRLELLNGEPPTLQAVADLGLRDRQYLRKQFEEVEGGIDLEVDLDCPSCGHEWKKDLDMRPDFFSPSET